MMNGKRLSILGDSISTYRYVSNDPSMNNTIGDNPYFYREPFPLERTYWRIVQDELGLSLCVNNSWSGGNLSGRDDQSSGVNRARELTDNGGRKPDLIIVFMGINDLGRGFSEAVFSADYDRTLEIIKNNYPDAFVCCVNLPDRDIVLKKRTELFNAAIEDAVERAGERFFVADLFNSPLNNDNYYNNTLDSLHPDEDGMREIARVVADAIKNHCK